MNYKDIHSYKKGYSYMQKIELIIENSRKLFLERGFKATNVLEIARLSNIAVGSFYKYFKSKEEVFLFIYESEVKSIKEKILDDINWENSFVEILQKFMKSKKNYFPRNNRVLEDVIYINNQAKVKEIDNKFQIFDSVVRSRLKAKLQNPSINEKEMDEILDVFDFLINIELNLNDNDKHYKERNIETIFRYMIKAIASSKL